MVIVVNIHKFKITLHLNGLFQGDAIISHVVEEISDLNRIRVVVGMELIQVATYLEKMLLMEYALKLFARKNPQHTRRVHSL